MRLARTTEVLHPAEDQRWLGKAHGTEDARSITLDGELFDLAAGGDFPDGFIPSGVALAKVTATGLYGPYDDAAVDGRAVCQGFLYTTKAAVDGDTRIGAALFWHGEVIEANLPTGHGLDANGKGDLNHIAFV